MRVLILLFLFLSACAPDQKPAKEIPQTPEDVLSLKYLPSEENLVVVDNTSNLENYLRVTGEPNSVIMVPAVVKSLNTVSEVKSITSSPGVEVVHNCIKSYSVNEECSISLRVLASTGGGLKIVRFFATQGVRYLILNITRSSASNQYSFASIPDIEFGTLTGSKITTKVVSIKNLSNKIVENVVPEMIGRDSKAFEIINSCPASLAPSAICNIRIRLKAGEKANGSYQASLMITADGPGTPLMKQTATQVVGNTISNQAPTWVNFSSLGVEADVNFSQSLGASDFEGDELDYSIAENSLGASVSKSGVLSVSPSFSQLGSHALTVYVSDGKHPAVSKTFNFNVYPKLLLSGTSFTEGDVLDPLFTMSFNGSRTITQIDSNIDQVFSVLKVTGSGTTGTNTSYLTNNQFPVISGGASQPAYNVSGGVKFAGSYPLNITVTFSDGSTHTYNKTIVINNSNLPVVRYDIYAVKPSNQAYNSSSSGYNSNNLISSAKELRRIAGNWRVPILTKVRIQPLICSGSEVSVFNYENHKPCLKDNASLDSETAFFFTDTYSSATNQVGGIALGTRAGFAVDINNVVDTLAHELGHNLGLFHTFESYANDYVYHKFPGESFPLIYSLVKNTGSRTLSTPGDWLNYYFDYNSSQLVSPFNFSGITDDLPKDYFNGKVVTLDNCIFQGFCLGPASYQSGVQALISYGGQSPIVSGYACIQNFATRVVTCSNIPDEGNITLSPAVVSNTMSYWYKAYGSGANSNFSVGQTQRMDRIILNFPELQTRPGQ